MQLRTLTTNTTSELNVLWHDRHALGVNGAEIRIFEQTDKIGFRGFLESENGRSLETQIGLEILGNFTHQTLKGQLANQQVRRLLVTTNFTESNSTRAVTMGLLYTAGCRWKTKLRECSSFGSFAERSGCVVAFRS